MAEGLEPVICASSPAAIMGLRRACTESVIGGIAHRLQQDSGFPALALQYAVVIYFGILNLDYSKIKR